jgi:hypothetical protein
VLENDLSCDSLVNRRNVVAAGIVFFEFKHEAGGVVNLDASAE